MKIGADLLGFYKKTGPFWPHFQKAEKYQPYSVVVPSVVGAGLVSGAVGFADGLSIAGAGAGDGVLGVVVAGLLVVMLVLDISSLTKPPLKRKNPITRTTIIPRTTSKPPVAALSAELGKLFVVFSAIIFSFSGVLGIVPYQRPERRFVPLYSRRAIARPAIEGYQTNSLIT
jgi:hypothetical protein